MIKVDATLLEQWADRHESWFALPELVRRLVHATAAVRWIDMPAGDCVLYPGWDGIIDAPTGTPWVPEGCSAWEIGTNRDYEAKAGDDYRKRLKDTRGIDAAQATYIFVTPRRWPNRQAWIDARAAESPWRTIRIYDASVLEQWLEQVPAIAHWFAAEVLRLPRAMLDRPSPTLGWEPDALRYEAGPLSWLTWKARLTGLIGRDAEKAELLRWARDTGGGVRFRFLVGEGGSGKTRLAHEVAAELAADPAWAAGLVPADKPLPLDAGLRGCLLLIDYPEEKREAVRARLVEIAAERPDPARPVRVLFLTRHGEEYWQPVVQDARAYVRMDPPCPLPEGVDPGNAWTIFQAALGRVPRRPGAPPLPVVDEEAFRRWIGRMPVNQRPLLISAAAVEAVHEPARPVLSLTGSQVIVALAHREAERLRPLARRHGFDEDALVRLTALAAVRGALDAATIRRLADPALDLNLGAAPGLTDRLRRTGCLTPDGLPAPVPDIVAAAFVVQALAAQDRASDWLWAVMDGDEATAIDRLGRLTYDADYVLGLGENFSACLARVAEAAPDRAARLEPHLRDDVIPRGLMALSAAVCRSRLDSATEDDERARWASDLSVHLAEMGDGESALAAIREAVEVYRRLTVASPAGYEANLALSLRNLSKYLWDSGDGAGALAAIREAVEVQRGLAAGNPAGYEAALALSLINLSSCLFASGDSAGALAAVREAVEIHRRLAAVNSVRREAALALSLNNLSNHLSDSGDGAGALAAIREAVEIDRRLAAASPSRYEAALALSLHNLSLRLSDSGDGAGALAAIRETVEIDRRLAAASPSRYEADLATDLDNLSNHLSVFGDGTGALAAIREAVEVCRRLVGANPARYEAALARSLNNLSNHLSAFWDRAGALAAIREAVEVYRRLAGVNPARYEANLATSLGNLSNQLSDSRDGAGALAAIREAVEIHRRLALTSPVGHATNLARSLMVLGLRLEEAGRPDEALALAEEAVRLNGPAARAVPGGPAGRLQFAMQKALERLRAACAGNTPGPA